MAFMEWIKREWGNVITIGCLVVAALIEATQQALSSSPKVAAKLPPLDGVWHYVPLVLLILAGVSWLLRPRHTITGIAPSEFKNVKWKPVNRVHFKNETVKIDSKRFYYCIFDNVTLEYDGTGPFEMIGCQSNGQLVAETSNMAARGYAHLFDILQSFGGQINVVSLDDEGHIRPSMTNVRNLASQVHPANQTVQQSSCLGGLPIYRHDLEIELLALCTGACLTGPATVFLLLKTWAKRDLNLVGVNIRISTADGNYEGTIIRNMSEWLLSVNQRLEKTREANLEDDSLSLVREIESGMFREGHHTPKWIGCELPAAGVHIQEKEVLAVKVDFKDKEGVAKSETFCGEWTKTKYRVFDVAFRL